MVVFSALANQRRYGYVRRAYRLYRDGGLEGAFIDYVLMEGADLEATPMGEVYELKRGELYWKRAATASYGMSSAICAVVILLSFYGALKAPRWVPSLFLALLMSSAYITYRSWRYFRVTGRKGK
ncbi:MAG: hypothetical protein QXR65_08730 [Candidatus Bathyarchaeia archaeon]